MPAIAIGIGIDYGQGGNVTSTYLPIVATSPAGVYGISKLVAAYAGASVRVVRASDSAQSDIGFVGANFDTASALTFQGASSLTVTKWYDQSGNGNDLVQATPASQPEFWLGAGGPTITNFTVARPLAIPTTLTANRQNVSVFMCARTPSEGVGVGMWEFGDFAGNSDLGLRSYATQFNMAPVLDGASPNATAENFGCVNITRMGQMNLVSSAAGITIHRDDQVVNFAATTSRSMTLGGKLGSTSTVPNGRFDLTAFVVYSAALGSTDYASVATALKTITTTAAVGNYGHICQGDSITFGTGCSNNRTWEADMGDALGPDQLMRNIGIAGSTAQAQAAEWNTKPLRFTVSGATHNMLWYWLGRNDIVGGASAATTISYILQCITQARANGVADKIIGTTALPGATGIFTAPQEVQRLLLNAWFRSAPLDNNGVPCFDAIDDQAADAVIGDIPTLAGNGMNLNQWSPDGIHPDEAANAQRVSQNKLAALQYLGIPVAVPVTVGAPVLSAAPVVTPSSAGVGTTLTCSAGTWTNTSGSPFSINPAFYAYQWKRDGASIPFATASTYLTVSADAGHNVTCVVTASNAGGSVASTSNAIAVSNALSISGTPVTTGTQGSPYGPWTATAGGGTPPYVYSDSGLAYPTGISINATTGVSSGTPTGSGTTTGIIITVTDAALATASLPSFNLVIAATYSGILDQISSTAIAAYGLRKLRNAYGGSAINVRRSSDNTVLDIGFDASGNLNTSALTAFVGSNSAFIATWYDQSGSVGLDMTQATTALQPRIVNAGTIDLRNSLPSMNVASTQGFAGSLTGSPASNTRTVSAVISHDNGANGDIVTASATGGFEFRANAAGTLGLLKVGTNLATSTTPTLTTSALTAVLASTTGSAQAFTVAGSAAGTGAATAAFTASLTAKLGQTSGMTCHWSEILIFDGSLVGGTDQTTIHTNQAAYYSVT